MLIVRLPWNRNDIVHGIIFKFPDLADIRANSDQVLTVIRELHVSNA